MPGFEVFGEEERAALNEIFDKSGGVVFAHGFGPMRNEIYRVRDFETAFAKKMNSKHGQAVSSGTAALSVALSALGLAPGDEFITQSHTFIATAEAGVLLGAKPVIVDIDDSLNMDPAALEAAITPKTKAIIPVHMLGVGAHMDGIMAVANKHGIAVLEDAAQALGGTYKGKHLGTFGKIGSYSTDSGKTLNTGEGGMVVTSDEELYIAMRSYHDHGHEYSKTLGRGQEAALGIGFNFRMSEMQGAVGIVQLGKLDYIIEKHRENKGRIKSALSGLPIKFRTIPNPDGDISDSLTFFLETPEDAQKVVAHMAKNGIGTKNIPDALNWHFSRNWSHMAPYLGMSEAAIANGWQQSHDLLSRAVAMPIMVKMEDERIEKIISTVTDAVNSIG